ncbi:MAG TPA: epoxide hydrolase [Tepidisphaeraceae bacterium]|jgi:microsomal epoxide hydrolase|nr:epoxide hydrolase [Tepidisphaeraceae bacterium]
MLEKFQISIGQPLLDDLSARLRATRDLPDSTDDWALGTSPAYLHQLITYWRDQFDWRAQERLLNQFQHFRGKVDGTTLHLIHEKGRGPSPLPLILTHGYPDSFFRFYKLIPLLTDPAAHGGDATDAFDVVIPSLPGYGFSEPRKEHGGLFGFGDLWHTLMTRELGYARFGAHGGDWGSTITEHLARSHASSVIGIHLTDVPFWHTFQEPKELSGDEQKYLTDIQQWQKAEGAYAIIQGTRPASLAVGLNDSPAGLAAWIIEKFYMWSDCRGNIESSFTRDELLTNVMLYWATESIERSFQPYADVMNAGAIRWIKEAAKNWIGSSKTPAGFACFLKDLSHPPREWAERFFNVQRWTNMPRGGHFAAMEEPETLAKDIREFFRPLR